jgi:hypothetical protein
MTIFHRHFTFKHPLFRKTETDTGVPWQKSIYYLWWEFLRRHESYKRTCETKGKGKYARLYEDFGDVHATDFKTWWSKGERGARLFSEPAVPMSVAPLKRDELVRLGESDWDSTSLLVVSIPLMLPKRFITQRLTDILRTHHTRKRGQRQHKESRARYPIAKQFNFYSLQTTLKVWDFRQKNPTMKLWEIAQALSFTTSLKASELGKRGHSGFETLAKKNTMGVAVRRKLTQAERIIDGVGESIFPAL